MNEAETLEVAEYTPSDTRTERRCLVCGQERPSWQERHWAGGSLCRGAFRVFTYKLVTTDAGGTDSSAAQLARLRAELQRIYDGPREEIEDEFIKLARVVCEPPIEMEKT